MTTPFTFTLTYREAMKMAKKLAHSMSKEATRYYLNGIFVCKVEGKHYAVSTDGHTLARLEIHPALAECNPLFDAPAFPDAILPAALVKQIEGFKPADRHKAAVIVTIDGPQYALECDGQKCVGLLVDGNYPDWQRVIPSGWQDYRNEYGTSAFNPALLEKVFKAAGYNADLFKSGQTQIRFHFQDGNPAVATETDPSVLYVVMPMRSSLPEHRHAEPATLAA